MRCRLHDTVLRFPPPHTERTCRDLRRSCCRYRLSLFTCHASVGVYPFHTCFKPRKRHHMPTLDYVFPHHHNHNHYSCHTTSAVGIPSLPNYSSMTFRTAAKRTSGWLADQESDHPRTHSRSPFFSSSFKPMACV